jgi:hypothetical protein
MAVVCGLVIESGIAMAGVVIASLSQLATQDYPGATYSARLSRVTTTCCLATVLTTLSKTAIDGAEDLRH